MIHSQVRPEINCPVTCPVITSPIVLRTGVHTVVSSGCSKHSGILAALPGSTSLTGDAFKGVRLLLFSAMLSCVGAIGCASISKLWVMVVSWVGASCLWPILKLQVHDIRSVELQTHLYWHSVIEVVMTPNKSTKWLMIFPFSHDNLQVNDATHCR